MAWQSDASCARLQCHYLSAPPDIFTVTEREALEARFANIHVLMFDVLATMADALPANWHYVPFKVNWHYVPKLPGRPVAIAETNLDSGHWAPTARVATPRPQQAWNPQKLISIARPLLASYISIKRKHPDVNASWTWQVKLQVCALFARKAAVLQLCVAAVQVLACREFASAALVVA
jgi:hypothetical protein